jgi:DNA replication protein DnaC
MTSNNTIDAARVELLLSELRLPAIKLMWVALAARADKEGWPAARFLAALAEHEMADRGRRRIERHLASARLPAGKTFDTFDFNAVPMVSKAQVMALAAEDGWLDQGANILLFGPPGGARAILRRRSVWLSSRTAGGCCSCAPQTSSRGCRWRAGS